MLRQFCLMGLKHFLETSLRLASTRAENFPKLVHPISSADGHRYCALLASYSDAVLSILFDIYTLADSGSRSLLLQIVQLYIGIADAKRVNVYFKTCVKRLLESITASTTSTEKQKESHAMMELTLAMAPYLDVQALKLLYRIVKPQLQSSDANLQKKSYKILVILLQKDLFRPFIRAHIQEIQNLMIDGLHHVVSSSKEARLRCIALVIDSLPMSSTFAFITSILGEVIVSTKELNEKTRYCAYNLLVTIGNKMKQNEPSSRDDDHEMMKYDASVTQFFKIILAGLAGATPYMVSGTVLAMTRVLYEFHGELESSCINETIQSMLLLLQSRSREIVKAVIGFVKVFVFSSSKQALENHLSEMVKSLLIVLQEHGHHFKEKIRHILKLLIRKFDHQTIEQLAPAEHRKFLLNIKRRTKRAIEKKNERNRSKPRPNTGHDTDHMDYEETLDMDGHDGDSDSNFSDNDESPKSYRPKTLEVRILCPLIGMN
jgi:ribosomal RNA-processing protein 12